MPMSERIIMRKPGQCRRRPPLKQEELLRHVVDQIVSGQLQPGQRLPTRNEFVERFQVNMVTVQRVFNQLLADRFVTVLPNRGTFVSERSPHRYRFALPFSERPGAYGWLRFWQGLLNAAHHLTREKGWWIDCLFGIDARHPTPELSALARDVRLGRLAGIFFPNFPFLVENTPILQIPGVPRSAFMSRHSGSMVAIRNSSEIFYHRALERLAAQGRRRPAFIGTPARRTEVREEIRVALGAAGLPFTPGWIQAVPMEQAHWAEDVVDLLFRGKAADTPDSLIISDDNLTESVCRGLVAAGLRVPERVAVVTHCNFPVSVSTVLPLIRLGYDLIGTMETVLRRLSHWRESGTFTPDPVRVEPLFAEELPAGHPASSPLVAATGDHGWQGAT